MKEVSIGQQVVYVDPHGIARPALVTNVFGRWGTENEPSINVVYVSGDENRTDSCGRQIERSTSTPHRSHQMAPGNFWHRFDE